MDEPMSYLLLGSLQRDHMGSEELYSPEPLDDFRSFQEPGEC